MATWQDLTVQDPELAAAASALLSVPGTGFGYLATVDRTGGPRIHPVMPVWVEGTMVLFVAPSPKLADLRRDGRYALHSTGSADVDDELMVADHAVLREDDVALRAAATAACPFVPPADHVLVELLLDRVMWAHYEPRGVFAPQYRVWRDPEVRAVATLPGRGPTPYSTPA